MSSVLFYRVQTGPRFKDEQELLVLVSVWTDLRKKEYGIVVHTERFSKPILHGGQAVHDKIMDACQQVISDIYFSCGGSNLDYPTPLLTVLTLLIEQQHDLADTTKELNLCKVSLRQAVNAST